MIYVVVTISIIVTGSALGVGVALIQNNFFNSQTNNSSRVLSHYIIMNQSDFLNASRDPFTINSVTLDHNLLTISVTYGGGCEDHDFALIASELWALSNPPQVGIVLSHDAHHDLCKALITKVLTFDLTPLKERYSYGQYQNNGTIVLKLEGYSNGIRYSFIKTTTLQLVTDQSIYHPGDDIHINISLINNGAENISLQNTLYTLSIYGPSGIVFSINNGGVFIHAQVVKPGDSFWIDSYTWNQTNRNFTQVPPGEYTIYLGLRDASYQGQTNVTIRN